MPARVVLVIWDCFDLGLRCGLFLPGADLVRAGPALRAVRCPSPGKPGTTMNWWLIWSVIGVVLCGCQTGGRSASDDCPAPSPCDEAGQERWPLFTVPVATFAVARPLWPGCPSTLQVMARPFPIVFRAVRPDDEAEPAPDSADWHCELPEAPLLRADRRHPGQDVAGR